MIGKLGVKMSCGVGSRACGWIGELALQILIRSLSYAATSSSDSSGTGSVGSCSWLV